MKNTLSNILVILGIFILLALGIWQIYRMSEKESLISDLEKKSQMHNIAPYEINEEYLYRMVELCGHYEMGKELFVYYKPNYIILAPFFVENSGQSILVARGIVKSDDKDKASFLIQNEDDICIAGMLLPSEREPIFMPDYNGSSKKPMLSINTESAGDILSISFPEIYLVLTDKTSNQLLTPLRKPTTENIYNNHLEYALTWFILAGILIFMFVTSKKNTENKSLKKKR